MASTYYAQILSWDWARITRIANDRTDAVMVDDQLVGSCYLGSVMSLTPSGKFYTFWTTNQTADDVDRDGRWYAALDRAAAKHGGYIENGEGDPTDLYFCVLIEDAPESRDGSVEVGNPRALVARTNDVLMDGHDAAAASVASHTEGN